MVDKQKRLSKKKRKRVIIYSLTTIILLSLLGIGLWYGFSPESPLADEDAATPALAVSTFTFYSAQDGEDVSSFVEVDIWAPKSGATFDDLYNDITDLTTNFERIETGKDADDVSIDLRDEPYYWLEITGNDVFNNTFHLLRGGANFDYPYNIHQTTSDVNFAILNSTMGAITIPGQTTTGNYTAELRVPDYTVADSHYGDNWAMSTTEFADLSNSTKEVYWNEMYWRDQYPTYDPTLDTINEYDRNFDKITNTFALKWTFNETINTTVGAAAELTCTIDKGYPIEVLISGADLFMVWDEGINFNPDYTFTFEMTFGADINVTTVISGRANVFGVLSTLTWAETYSVIGL